MSRLTAYSNRKPYLVMPSKDYVVGGKKFIEKEKNSIKKLAAYEDIIEDPATLSADLAELAHYRELKAAGRLVELPCKVGDTVWCLYSIPRTTYDRDKLKWFIDCFIVERFSFRNWVSADISQFGTVNIKEFDKTIFLTKEEAEKALEGMK